MYECPICYNTSVHIFENAFCKHKWCKDCHKQLIMYTHTSCVMCRQPIFLKKRLQDAYGRFLWHTNGGKVMPKWLKKYKKRLSNSVVKI